MPSLTAVWQSAKPSDMDVVKPAVPFDPFVQPQATGFLAMPPELRNVIYSYIAQRHELAVCAVTPRQLRIYQPPLMQTCRQVQREYVSVWLEEAPLRADTVSIHIRNFEGDYVVNAISTLLPSPAAGVHRKFIIHLHLDNYFEQTQVKKLVGGYSGLDGPGEQLGPAFAGFRMSFDPQAFDVHFAEQYFAKTQMRLRGLGTVKAVCKWRVFQQAFELAKAHYEQI
ncbi:hypothetical protein BAUCODRAFT_387614 [Baudoinia panamericana UAMH 10762]|uniref:F-box domain-containing protein n=1 Tax=Baudoinia panamericana (strain UAMH 10762) TaxID=717646 RepID=M2MQG0_BAUPA|nr:uncharacterized protein BAUCODRAFT_387614 [Baudoinia panamericana UAMH 10762]EMC99011.1 hypothetical protein BAUCODRAFT_387614 [Baudoinia panamericana UAMH 10762]